MANRNFPSAGKLYSYHVMPVLADCTIQIGASGAVTSFTGSLVKSVARTATGAYTISLMDPYTKVFAILAGMQAPASGLSGIVAVEAQHSPNATIVAPTQTVSIVCANASDAAADPASGSAINVLILLSNSSVVVPGE